MIAGLSKNRFNSVQLKDIVRRNKIRDGDLLERIISCVTANVGTTFSATALAGFLKNEQRTVAPETIQVLLRRLSVLSSEAGGPAGKADPCFQRKYYIRKLQEQVEHFSVRRLPI